MRIGFLGNTNSYPFQLAEVFKEKGIEVVFIVDADKEDKLNRPEYLQHSSITYPYPPWVIEKIVSKSWKAKLYPAIFAKDVIDILNTCDAVILNGIGHGYKPFINKEIPSISLFSGSDLDISARLDEMIKLSDKRPVNFLPLFLRKKLLSRYVNLVREGIKQSYAISYFPITMHPEADKLIAEIKGILPYKRFEHFHARVDNIDYVPPVKKDKIIVFNLARFIWQEPLPKGFRDWENKRNDIMIRGLAQFIKNNNCEIAIHFVEKGAQVEATKKLADEVGLSPYITWHKEMSLQEVMDFYINSDIIFDQLGQHIIGGGMHAMAVGRPVIANARPDIFEKSTGIETQICHATNEVEVEGWLKKLVFDERFRIEKGKQSRAYVLKYLNINIEADFFINCLKEYGIANNNKID